MNIEKYKIVFSPTSKRELENIFQYISQELHAPQAAQNLMKKINKKIQIIARSPQIYTYIGYCDDKGRKYRKISVKRYILLYVIAEEEHEVRISHIFYNKSNYFNKL